MDRRQSLIAGTGLLVAGCSAVPKCPCVDPEDNPQNPLERNHVHICAFHVRPPGLQIQERLAGQRKGLQLEVTHYCTPVSEGVFQCLLYDDCKPGAKLIGVEYVIVEDLYKSLSEQEKELWHPHNFEVNEGLLTIHGVPKDCEKKLLKALVNSYGKSFHTWPDPSTKVPLGLPILMWSSTGENQIRQELIDNKNKKYDIDNKEIKRDRADLLK
jgi:hypothetical protein